MLNLTSLTYSLLRPNDHLSTSDTHVLNEIYRVWKQGWSQTYGELQSASLPASPDFIRQGHVGGIFYNENVISVQAYSSFHLTNESHREHPYLKSYPQGALEDLVKQGKRNLMTMEYLYVSPAFRRSVVGFRLSAVMCALGLHVFYASPANVMCSITRNERRVNEMLYEMGAAPFVTGQSLHNVEVDIIIFQNTGEISGLTPVESELVKNLWAQQNLIPKAQKEIRTA